MPAPISIVTFKDADGDEFPVSVHVCKSDKREDVIEAGRVLVLKVAREGKDWWSPTMPLRFVSASGVWNTDGTYECPTALLDTHTA